MTKRRTTNDALEIIYRRYYEGRPKRIAELELARQEAAVARKIQELRNRAGLTQQQLAKLVGTTPSVISRLEDVDYDGHSLKTLQRIASALDCVVEVRFVPRRKPAKRATAS
jgi:DNA-binding XRE family transcriptional regulator